MLGASLIIPTYNRSDSLFRSLTSLQKRNTYSPCETIIIDGGSSEEHKKKIREMCSLYDGVIWLKHDDCPSNHIGLKRAYIKGVEASNPEYPYIYMGADDLWYRTGWLNVMVDMIESEWAKKNHVEIPTAYNHWVKLENVKYMGELYKSADGNVEGFMMDTGGNYFMRKEFFRRIGGFEDNIGHNRDNFETLLTDKCKKFDFKFGCTVETYIQHMAEPNSSLIGNYMYTGGCPNNNEFYRNGIGIGMLWRDE